MRLHFSRYAARGISVKYKGKNHEEVSMTKATHGNTVT